MGAFLASPKTEKHSEFGGSKEEMTSEYGASAMQGWRQTMEDAHVAIPSLKALVESAHAPPSAECVKAFAELQAMDIEDIGIYGVFDGHGSNAVSQWTAANLLTIFSERLLSVRSEMEAKGLSMPRGSCRAGQSCDKELVTKENAVLCQAIEDAFLAVDERIQTPESRHALLKIFQDGQREQHGTETYLEWFLKNGGDARVIDMNGQRYIQLLVGNEEGAEGSEGPHSPDSQGQETETHESSPSSSNDDASGEGVIFWLVRVVNAADAGTKEEDSDCEKKQAADSGKSHALGRLDSTANAATDGGKSAVKTEAGPSPPAETGPCGDEASHAEEQFEGEKSASEGSEKDAEDAELSCAADAQRNEHPHPSSPEGSGATSVVVLVVKGPTPVLIVANAGDSRGIISRGGVAFPLSHDHKPMNPGERARIAAAGGSVTNGRVDGNLNLSRSLGDLYYKADADIPPEKQRITAFPDVRGRFDAPKERMCLQHEHRGRGCGVIVKSTDSGRGDGICVSRASCVPYLRITPICKDDEFVIIACDGIWDCKTNQEAVDFVRARLAESKKPSPEALRDACEALCDDCLSHDPIKSEGHGCDNMTVVIVDLSTKLREKGCSSARVVLYGGGEDLYLGQDEAEFEAEDDD
ncbi:protein phosphatase 2c domain-containing protein [Cyclospora cayetanensis]|uniref:Protein phosphatase 2c domain-containing protein n=1 Tax=Cyclospora cayetanensis TaxID=88456 RepID=A0A1D3CRY2_9EIME|nr:protein phosphatase 2c domain-containing protein [Cyclospora cayetanensis]